MAFWRPAIALSNQTNPEHDHQIVAVQGGAKLSFERAAAVAIDDRGRQRKGADLAARMQINPALDAGHTETTKAQLMAKHDINLIGLTVNDKFLGLTCGVESVAFDPWVDVKRLLVSRKPAHVMDFSNCDPPEKGAVDKPT